MKRSMLYLHHSEYETSRREVVQGEGGVDNITLHEKTFIVIDYHNGNSDWIPMGQVLIMKMETDNV